MNFKSWFPSGTGVLRCFHLVGEATGFCWKSESGNFRPIWTIPTPLESSFQSRLRMPHFQTSAKDFSAPKIQFEIQILLGQCNDRSILGEKNGNFACKFQNSWVWKKFSSRLWFKLPSLTTSKPNRTLNFLENSMAAQKSPVHFEIQISVNLSDFQQIQVKFHQPFCQDNEVKPWKSLDYYQIYRSFDEREEERKKKSCFWQK